MASTAAADRLTEAHRLAQSRLGVSMVELLLRSWRLIDPFDLSGTVPGWLRLVLPAVEANFGRSSALASDYMRAFKALELGRPSPLPAVPVPFNLEAVRTSLIVTGPVNLRQQTARGVPIAAATSESAAKAAGASLRHTLDGGRRTVVETVKADRDALGWARKTSGSPCAFCAMLAGRGPVYKGRNTSDFQPHDSCSCSAEPVYRDGAWPAGSRQFAELYDRAARGERDQLNAFRRAYETDEMKAERNARRRELYAERKAAAEELEDPPT